MQSVSPGVVRVIYLSLSGDPSEQELHLGSASTLDGDSPAWLEAVYSQQPVSYTVRSPTCTCTCI